jgi:hypothetical protein
MTQWRFSDGTTAHLGGRIEGESVFARELWAAIARGKLRVPIRMPNIGLAVDVNDLALFDAWLRHEAGRPYNRAIEIIEAPANIPPLPRVPGDDDPDEPGVLY